MRERGRGAGPRSCGGGSLPAPSSVAVGPPLGLEVGHLPADHPAGPAASASVRTQPTAASAGRTSRARTSNASVSRRIAGQDRRRLVERLVAGRPAAAQVVVVHRRQVVVDQRVGVDHLHRAGRGHRRRRVGPAGLGRHQRQERPQPLAARPAGCSASPRPAAPGSGPPGRRPRRHVPRHGLIDPAPGFVDEFGEPRGRHRRGRCHGRNRQDRAEKSVHDGAGRHPLQSVPASPRPTLVISPIVDTARPKVHPIPPKTSTLSRVRWTLLRGRAGIVPPASTRIDLDGTFIYCLTMDAIHECSNDVTLDRRGIRHGPTGAGRMRRDGGGDPHEA